ncbi:sensor histidine kinase [Glaciihabitans sp. UYNi722]|uniref:sensor histidine kinase n=1 Tax=Glaciihabitans sp. UYNi722 TaxID=3156344 RepID=UPI00339765BD
MMRRRIRKLSSQIFLAQLVILVVSLAVGFALFAATARANLDHEYQSRAAAIGQAFAENPSVQECMATEDPACQPMLQTVSSATAARTGASYVVLIDMQRIRHSHPNAELIGKQVSEPIVALDGKVHLGVDAGATGVNASARVPLYSLAGTLIGEVSVGIQESSVSSELLAQLPTYGIWVAAVLAIGALASFALATILKRRTFGLELDEVARLFQEREATLHGIREGVIALDAAGRITVINDEARRLLGLRSDAIDHRLDEILGEGPLSEALAGASVVADAIVVTDDYCLVINRMPVVLAGRPHGSVVTLQDQTNLEALTRELDGERSFTESIRAQQHEFANRLHAIAGLLELERPGEALEYIEEIRGSTADFDQTLRSYIEAPQIVGLLLGKAAEAHERGIDFTISPESRLSEAPGHVQALTTILGNLIDNAFDALSESRPPRRVAVSVVEALESLVISVSDSGPGLPDGAIPQIFSNGYTTKRGSVVRHIGLGLSLVERTVGRFEGSITVSEGPGATFTVVLPLAPVPTPQVLS